MPTYPAPPPTLTGDVETISRFLNSPTDVQRRVRDISLNRYLTDFIFPGRIEASGGAILYEIAEGQFLAKDPEAVNPGAQYTRTTEVRGTAAIAAVKKWGEDVPLTDEQIKRMKGLALNRTLTKLANTMIKKVDSVAMAAAGAAITQTQTTAAAWDTDDADPFLDVMLADATVVGLDQGYEPDVLVLTDVLYARMVANQKVINGLAREAANTVTSDGQVLMIAGKTIARTNHLPNGIDRLLIDREQFGALGYEDLESPEYEGDPANGVETWVRRDPDANDTWLLRGRRPVVPVVLEPNAGISIEDS
ncbi:MAG TPA: hypothetical protein VFE15_15525 [Marmoricola sp.]|jgi:hypothetical protein|nr:hypothetical protein [Marmoricola sp.]